MQEWMDREFMSKRCDSHSASYISRSLWRTAMVNALSWCTMSPIRAQTPVANLWYHRPSLGLREATYRPLMEEDDKATSQLPTADVSHMTV